MVEDSYTSGEMKGHTERRVEGEVIGLEKGEAIGLVNTSFY